MTLAYNERDPDSRPHPWLPRYSDLHADPLINFLRGTAAFIAVPDNGRLLDHGHHPIPPPPVSQFVLMNVLALPTGRLFTMQFVVEPGQQPYTFAVLADSTDLVKITATSMVRFYVTAAAPREAYRAPLPPTYTPAARYEAPLPAPPATHYEQTPPPRPTVRTTVTPETSTYSYPPSQLTVPPRPAAALPVYEYASTQAAPIWDDPPPQPAAPATAPPPAAAMPGPSYPTPPKWDDPAPQAAASPVYEYHSAEPAPSWDEPPAAAVDPGSQPQTLPPLPTDSKSKHDDLEPVYTYPLDE